jgi:ribosomal peptide maturation radical SAM protein 1
VALVSLPFASAKRPSIQIGLLKSILVSCGFPTTTFHLSSDFAAQIGPAAYEALCRHRKPQIGDWLFSCAAFGTEAPDPSARFLHDFNTSVAGLLADLDRAGDFLIRLRDHEVPRFLNGLMSSIAWDDFRVVGFTSTFQQNVASFALATLIKRRFPRITTIFGGANFDGEMGRELVRAASCIDYAITGEADRALPGFMIALQEQRDPTTVAGVIGRRNGAVTDPLPQPLLKELDHLPTPDYREFFERAEALGLRHGTSEAVYIPFESARGCWWGQKHHCTFCGLNGAGMSFRAKSPGRLQIELAELAQRHHSFHFEAVDNILDISYLDSFFGELVKAGIDYRLFYEVKSNLSRQQLRLLAQAGVHRIQPGIESLSAPVLKRMRKGVTAVQNVNLLRWALYYRIHVSWNLIWGFPHETETDYENQLALLRQVVHLPPPIGAGRIWLERFSPLYFDRETFPAVSIRPEASYSYVYPRNFQLDRVAYFFDYELADTLPDSVFAETLEQVERWRTAWKQDPRPRLSFWYAPGLLTIQDARDRSAAAAQSFADPEALLYASCSDQPRGPAELKQRLGLALSEKEIGEILRGFCARGVMMCEGERFLSLALPASMGR